MRPQVAHADVRWEAQIGKGNRHWQPGAIEVASWGSGEDHESHGPATLFHGAIVERDPCAKAGRAGRYLVFDDRFCASGDSERNGRAGDADRAATGRLGG